MRFVAPLGSLVALLVSLGHADAASASDGLCEGVAAVSSFELDEFPMTYVIDHTVDSSGLELRARTLTAYLGRTWHANGLASATSSFESSMEMVGVQGRDGVCMGLGRLAVTYGYPKPVDILVVNRYPEGSCEYDAILTHEARHYEIYRSTAFDSYDSIRAGIEAFVTARLPVRAPDVETAKSLVRDVVDAASRQASDGISSEAARLNAEIDNPRSYAEVKASCTNW